MPDADTLTAAKNVLIAFRGLVEVLGPGWTLVWAVVGVGLFIGISYWRAREADKGWERTLGVKDDMIELINEQNRELRVQAMVVGRQFTKEEAVKLVYGDDRLAPSGAPVLQSPKK